MAENEETQFEAYMRGMESRMTARIDQSVGQVREEQAKLAQVVQQGATRPAPPAAPVLDDAAGDKLLQELGGNPIRFFGEMGQINNQAAEAIAGRKIAEFEQRMNAKQMHQDFWGGFVQHNEDVAAFLPMVQGMYDKLPKTMDDSARADEAAKTVRALLNQRNAGAVESDRRTTNAARMTSTPGTVNDPSAGRQESERPQTAAERAHNTLADMEEWRAKRMVGG